MATRPAASEGGNCNAISRPREPTQASRSRMTSQLHAAMEKAELDRYLADGYGVKSNPFTADVGRREN